tara:strand:- start:748 stop:972 length:225 start_codon:yes stop_codon:yes gene_type:complete
MRGTATRNLSAFQSKLMATCGFITTINIITMLAKLFNYLWDMKLSFIRRRPMLACWLAWLEGILIGVLIMYFWG